MKAFIDTSSLIKRYIEEGNYTELDDYLESASELIISPITTLEFHSIIERKLRDKSMSPKEAQFLEQQFKIDLNYIGIVQWNSHIESAAQKLIRSHQLKALDAIQLAAGKLSGVDLFITSDKKLFLSAEKEIIHTVYIG